jgi:16S rRNA processing protein RimM
MNQSEPEVVIGVITAPFGIKGEVKVRMETDFPERFRELEGVYVKLPSAPPKVLEIESVRFHKGQALVKFKGVDDINGAEEYRGGELRIDVSQLVKLPKGHYYLHDLIGMDVVTEDGKDLGKITEVLSSSGNDVFVTEQAMIPAAKEFVKEINLEQRKVLVCHSSALETEEA